MIQFEFDHMVDLHQHWLRDPRFGARADFTNKKIDNIDGSNKDLSKAIFDNTRIFFSDFSNTKFDNTSFYKARLDNITLHKTSFKEANMLGTEITNTDIDNADFWNTTGDGVHIISLQLGGHNVCYTDSIVQVNCKQFPIGTLWTMSDSEILSTVTGHSESELFELSKWWGAWKYQIRAILTLYPAKSTI